MSHVKNMQAFEKLMGICTGLGGTYNPGQQNLQVNAMATLLNIAQQNWDALKEAQAAYDQATNQRELGFQKIKKLSMAIYGMVKVSGADRLLLDDALNSKRRIWGAQIVKPPAILVADGPEVKPVTRPSYSQGYATIAEYFDKLVKTVAMAPGYQPNEAELKLDNLQYLRTELFALNRAVTEAEIRLVDARMRRNAVCYVAPNNLVDTANNVKTYVRSAFGFRSQQHQQVQKLQFTKPRL